jgi:hypothetical protein
MVIANGRDRSAVNFAVSMIPTACVAARMRLLESLEAMPQEFPMLRRKQQKALPLYLIWLTLLYHSGNAIGNGFHRTQKPFPF